MKNLKPILLVLLSFFLFGCPDREGDADSTIIFVNNSDKTLLQYCRDNYYPDTSIIVTGNPFDERVMRFAIKPHSTYKKEDDWRRYLSMPKSTGVMTILLFDKAIVDTVSWDKIRKDYLVAKRYEYTLKQLDSLNWTITYP